MYATVLLLLLGLPTTPLHKSNTIYHQSFYLSRAPEHTTPQQQQQHTMGSPDERISHEKSSSSKHRRGEEKGRTGTDDARDRRRDDDADDDDASASSVDDDNDKSDRKDRRRKTSHKKSHKKRKHHHTSSSQKKRRRRDDGSSDSDSDDDDDDSRSYSSTSTSEESDDDRRDRKHHKKSSKRKRKQHKSSSKKRKDKKDKKHKKDKKKSSKKDDKDDDKNSDDGAPVFGKYGILKASDFHTKQRSFEIWMAEVKGMPEYRGPKWETQQYFDEYREDYNTATLPHKKYYDYDKWEMAEYTKQKEKQREAMTGTASGKADEVRHQLEQRRLAQQKQLADANLVMSMMSREKVEEMKRQQVLKAELEMAFKTGDTEKVKKLKAKLEPEER